MEREHGPPAEGAASFHTTRWTIVMNAAQSQAPGGEFALANSGALPSYEEVANKLQVSTGAVKTLIHRLRKR
ncbi:MAG: hypothetical protein JO170_16665 [Verrucomicrobia bacterium]|nr:hypothetical protein [Verrucomicrobiota bacterium]